MFIFDLQRFAEEEAAEDTQTTEVEETPAEEPAAEEEPKEAIPDELAGVSEDVAREVMAQAQKEEPHEEEEAQEQEDVTDAQTVVNQTADEPPLKQPNQKIPYARFKQQVDKTNELEAMLKQYQQRFGDLNAPQQQAQPQVQQLVLQPFVHQLVQALAEDVGFPQLFRVVLKAGQQAAGKVLALLFGAHDGAEFGVDSRLQHLDGWRAGFQTDPIACPLPHDLRLFQLQFADRRHHNAIAGRFHLLKGTAHLLVLALRPRQLHDAGHQARFITNGKAGLLAQHLIENFRFQLYRDAHAAGRKVDAADG